VFTSGTFAGLLRCTIDTAFEAGIAQIMKTTFGKRVTIKQNNVLNIGVLIFLFASTTMTTSVLGQSSVDYVTPNRPSVNPLSGEAANVRLVNLKEDVTALQREVRQLEIRLEQSERDRAVMKAQMDANVNNANTYATKEELRAQEARTNTLIAAEGKRVESVVIEEIRAARKGTQTVPVAAPILTNAAAGQGNYSNTQAVERPQTGMPVVRATVSQTERDAYMKEGVRYVVQTGDTLTSIARKNKSSVKAIMAVNEIGDPSKLWVGRELFVPVGAAVGN
jgi:LysM repeat protein